MKKITMFIISILFTVFLLICLFIWFLTYSSTNDLSHDIRFKKYLNKPLIVKRPSVLKYTKESEYRFSAYFIDNYNPELNGIDETVLKKYEIGDTIVFSSAKSYFSNHVGETYYLLGETELESGETITFEYYASFEYIPALWETENEFLARRKIENQ